MRAVLGRFLKDEAGATAIEYALLAALVAMALVGTLVAVGNSLEAVFGAGTGGPTDVINDATSRL